MNREDIIHMAREAGFDHWWDSGNEQRETLQEHIERFAALVAAAEREACANAVWECPGMGLDDQRKAMSAIRARGQA